MKIAGAMRQSLLCGSVALWLCDSVTLWLFSAVSVSCLRACGGAFEGARIAIIVKGRRIGIVCRGCTPARRTGAVRI
jgi:hypothetical protein